MSEARAEAHRIVRVAPGGNVPDYEVRIGSRLIQGAGAAFTQTLGSPRLAFIVADEKVAPLYCEPLARSLEEAGWRTARHIVPAGEASKSFAALEACCRGLVAAGADRRSVVAALGGGVVGDLAGLAAALALRGLDFVQLPTTLLAQVDSAVGGKTAVDLPEGKNLAGRFHHPRLVLADSTALATLPARERSAGLAEVVKYGLGFSEAFLVWQEENAAALAAGEAGALAEAVERSLAQKAAVVAADAGEESGTRALLNLGHSFAHALEAECGFDAALLHGEAVAVGMVLAARLSERLGLAEEGLAERARALLARFSLPTGLDAPVFASLAPEGILAAMGRDKKNLDGRLRLVLLCGVGQAFFPAEADDEALLALLAESFAGAG